VTGYRIRPQPHGAGFDVLDNAGAVVGFEPTRAGAEAMLADLPPLASKNTAARRKASAAFHAKLKAQGQRQVTVWLSPEAVANLDAAAPGFGSRSAAADFALRQLKV